MIEQELLSLGFSFFMCGWFMFRNETAIKNNTKALQELIMEIKRK